MFLSHESCAAFAGFYSFRWTSNRSWVRHPAHVGRVTLRWFWPVSRRAHSDVFNGINGRCGWPIIILYWMLAVSKVILQPKYVAFASRFCALAQRDAQVRTECCFYKFGCHPTHARLFQYVLREPAFCMLRREEQRSEILSDLSASEVGRCSLSAYVSQVGSPFLP